MAKMNWSIVFVTMFIIVLTSAQQPQTQQQPQPIPSEELTPPPADGPLVLRYTHTGPPGSPVTTDTTFMQRIANWFGFGATNASQEEGQASNYNQNYAKYPSDNANLNANNNQYPNGKQKFLKGQYNQGPHYPAVQYHHAPPPPPHHNQNPVSAPSSTNYQQFNPLPPVSQINNPSQHYQPIPIRLQQSNPTQHQNVVLPNQQYNSQSPKQLQHNQPSQSYQHTQSQPHQASQSYQQSQSQPHQASQSYEQSQSQPHQASQSQSQTYQQTQPHQPSQTYQQTQPHHQSQSHHSFQSNQKFQSHQQTLSQPQQKPQPPRQSNTHYPSHHNFQIQHQYPKYEASSSQHNYQKPQHISLPTYFPFNRPVSPTNQQFQGPPPPLYPPQTNYYAQQYQSNYQSKPPHASPILVPNLSVSPIPPIYPAKPFLSGTNAYANNFSHQTPPKPFSLQSNTEFTPSPHNPYGPLPLRISTPDSEIEIIKSISLGEFSTSVTEYPPSKVQDISITVPPRADEQSYKNHQNAQQHAPLNEPLSVKGIPTSSISPIETFTLNSPIIVHDNNQELGDSHPEASSLNVTSEQIDDSSAEALIQNASVNSKESRRGDIEIQESIQTTADKSVNKKKESGLTKKDRDTPKDLLDSPISYAKNNVGRPFTKDPNEFKVTNSPTYDYSPWTPTQSFGFVTPSSIASAFSSTPPRYSYPTTQPDFKTSPSPTFSSSTSVIPLPEKKSKKIQIIIPYTTSNQPSPFKVNNGHQDFGSSSGWSSQAEDYHQGDESKLVTATQVPLRKTTKYLTKVLASNIRNLLHKENVPTSSSSQIDIKKLQRSIDTWTEQEFSGEPAKASTISLLAQPKEIPSEYLLTTPIVPKYIRPTTTVPSTDVQTTTDQPTANYERLFADQPFDVVFNRFIDENKILQETIAPTTTTTSTPSTTTTTTTTTKSPSLQTPDELWNSLRVAISPLTKEKVYVVTPQPLIAFTENKDNYFHVPRFSVRPTPGVSPSINFQDDLTGLLVKKVNELSLTTKKPTKKGVDPELFGLLGVGFQSYSPPTPVETLDGHSKVITVVTPSTPNKKKNTKVDEKKPNTKSST